jgi:hypothetical protein
MINENVSERKSCFSTHRDMYLEVLECLNDVNRSIYGLPVIVVFISGNFCEIITMVYKYFIFLREFIIEDRYYFVFTITGLFLRTVNLIILYKVGHITEKEVFKYYIM